MKRAIFMIAISIATFTIMAFTFKGNHKRSPLYSYGALPGLCGDPAGGGANCTVCHRGAPATTQKGWITSTIPSGGYIADSTYTITATATRAGHIRFGFEISPQNSSGTFLGTIIITNSQTQLTSGNSGYITHTSSGVTGSGSKTWTFNWQAPTSGSGPVTFYGAFNITNADNTFYGDTVMLSTLTVNENTAGGTSTGISEDQEQANISVYPNPFTTSATVHSTVVLNNASLTLYNSTGQLVEQQKNISGQTVTLYRNDLPAGQYFIQLVQNQKIIMADKVVITN